MIDDLVDLARVDDLAERFREQAQSMHPISAMEVMCACIQVLGETALDVIPSGSDRVAVCQALIKRMVEDAH